MKIKIIITIILIILLILYVTFLYLFNKKINLLEQKIISNFEKRSNLIPILYKISQKYLENYDIIFKEILNLRKNEFDLYNEHFLVKIYNEKNIHSQLDFIFKLLNTVKNIENDSTFLLIRDLFLIESNNIWKKINLYKNILPKYNNLLRFKNFTIIWFMLDFEEKHTI